jgi:hypothetical protein
MLSILGFSSLAEQLTVERLWYQANDLGVIT